MAEAAKKEAAEKQEGKKEKPPRKKKTLPTNCAETNVRIRRKNWYYKNGKYFASKAAANLHFSKLAEEKKKAEAEAKEKAAAPAENKAE